MGGRYGYTGNAPHDGIVMEILLNQSEMPAGFHYPPEFLAIVRQKLLDFDPWIILTKERLRTRTQGLRERYPARELVPIAKREYNDDLACFEKNKGVVIIHDFASPGFEGGQTHIPFWDWLRLALEDIIAYNS